MKRQALIRHPVDTVSLFDEILAIQPVTASYGHGHVANSGNGLVQNNITYVCEPGEPELESQYVYPDYQVQAPVVYPEYQGQYQSRGWNRALTIGCTLAMWTGWSVLVLVVLSFIAIAIVAYTRL
jgi:hypothetical protein